MQKIKKTCIAHAKNKNKPAWPMKIFFLNFIANAKI